MTSVGGTGTPTAIPLRMNDDKRLIELTNADLENVDGGAVHGAVIICVPGPYPYPYPYPYPSGGGDRWDHSAPVTELY